MAEKKNELVETIKTVFWALIIAGVFRTVFFQPFFIPTGSMKDTLLIGDFVFVNKMAYGYSKYSCPWAMCLGGPCDLTFSRSSPRSPIPWRKRIIGHCFLVSAL